MKIEERFIQLAKMLNDMIGEESEYDSVPKNFSMPEEVILKTANLLQKAYNKKEFSEDSNGSLYYVGMTEDFGGLIDYEYYKQLREVLKEQRIIKVYFQIRYESVLVAKFDSDDTYRACLPALEKLAEKDGYDYVNGVVAEEEL